MDGDDEPPLSGLVVLDVRAVARMVATLRGEGSTRARRVLVLARVATFLARRSLAPAG